MWSYFPCSALRGYSGQFLADLTPKDLFMVAEILLIAPVVTQYIKMPSLWISIAIRLADKTDCVTYIC